MTRRHICFISFKKENEEYKKEIQKKLGKDFYIDQSLDERINSEDHEYVMKVLREDYISKTTVTIVLIGNHSAENLGEHEQFYIKREIAASLYNGEDNTRNGILGVVLPEAYDKVFKGSYKCIKCGGTHNTVVINDTTVVKEFSFNYYLPNPEKDCCWMENDRYCVLVKYDDFMNEPDVWLDKAFEKRDNQALVNKIRVRL